MTPFTASPRRLAAGLAIAAALATSVLGGAVAANAAPTSPHAAVAHAALGHAAAAKAPAPSTYWARPLLSTDLSVTGTQIEAYYFKVDSTPTAAGREVFVDEMDLGIGCMAAKGFYVDPTDDPSKPNSTAAARTAWSQCVTIFQQLVGPRDEN